MKTYKVQITETLQKVLLIEAHSQDAAQDIVGERWNNGDEILDADDFVGVKFDVLED
jgi:hypothetical protein